MTIENATIKYCKELLLSVATPTYGREQVLIDTIRYVFGQEPSASEMLILDQTPQQEGQVCER